MELSNVTVTGNKDDSTPAPSSFDNEKPAAVINSVDSGTAGSQISFSSGSSDPDGSISHVLWDFNDGTPESNETTTHTYSKEGTYRVTLIVWDNAGRSARVEKTITIGSSAATPTPAPGLSNIALNKAATAKNSIGDGEASKAVDGSMETKWLSDASGDNWLSLDLGQSYNISRWVVKNAEAGGEAKQNNTKDFTLQKSTDGITWVDVDTVKSNKDSITDRNTTFSSRYVRLYITKPCDGTDKAARIYEFELFGKPIRTPIPMPTPTPRPTPEPTAAPTPAPGAVFVKGINFNGDAVTIEGNKWLSYSDALADGLSFSVVADGESIPFDPNLAATSLTPSPSTDSDTSRMLNSVVWSGNSFTINQTLPNGDYQIYLWVIENYLDNFRAFDVNLEGTQVASAIGRLPNSSWVKYGPYNVTVKDGTMNCELVKVENDPQILGMAIYSN
jgi:PKD repeat protein